MRNVFADDVTMDTADSGGGVVTGADAFMAFLQDVIGDVVTVHQCHTPEIDITSATTATGIWAMEDMLRWDDPEAPLETLHGYGHYRETYRKIDGCWLVQTMKLTRMRVDIIGKGGVKLR